jgi:hypothetical protein
LRERAFTAEVSCEKDILICTDQKIVILLEKYKILFKKYYFGG